MVIHHNTHTYICLSALIEPSRLRVMSPCKYWHFKRMVPVTRYHEGGFFIGSSSRTARTHTHTFHTHACPGRGHQVRGWSNPSRDKSTAPIHHCEHGSVNGHASTQMLAAVRRYTRLRHFVRHTLDSVFIVDFPRDEAITNAWRMNGMIACVCMNGWMGG